MAEIEAAVSQVGRARWRHVRCELVAHGACPPTEFSCRPCDRAHVALHVFEHVRRIVGITQRGAGLDRRPQPLSGEPPCSVGVAPLDKLAGRSRGVHLDRKSTRLNSSHGYISYAVFCLKKKPKSTRALASSHHHYVPEH